MIHKCRFLLKIVLWVLPSLASLHAQDRGPARPNVLLITIDTLRADALGSYGKSEAGTPVLDQLARDGVLFENAYCQVPMTPPSHASILTGTYPATHGLRDFTFGRLRGDLPTLAEILSRQGYQTAAFVSAFVLDRSWGFAKGFQDYFDQFDPSEFERVNPGNVQRRAEETVDLVLDWLETAEAPYLVWLHLFDPHHDYDPPEPFRSRFRTNLYQGEVAYADSQIGRIVERLKERREYDSSLIIAVSDHGEALGSHGEQEHGFFLYEEVVRVPLIFKLPGQLKVPSEKVEGIAQTVDILPTILQTLRITDAAASSSMEGRGLLSEMLGKRGEPGFAFGETLYPQHTFGWSSLRFFRQGDFKYIEAPRRELYDLSSDPNESNNLAGSDAAMAAQLRGSLLELESRFQPLPVSAEATGTDSERTERLRSLGYVAVAQPLAGSNIAGLSDPKDKIDTYNQVLQALQAAEANQLQRSNQILEAVLSNDPSLFIAHHQMGSNYMQMNDPEKALKAYEEARKLNPDFPSTNLGAARALAALGRPQEAIQVLEGASRSRSPELAIRKQLALLYTRVGRHREAIQIYADLLKERPDDSQSLKFLGILQVQAQEYAAGLENLDKALGISGEDALIQNSRGIALDNLGRTDDAIATYRRAIELNPAFPQPHLNLASTLLRIGRKEDALTEFEKVCGLNKALCDRYRERFQ